MLPAIYDFAIYQGDTWERTIDLADSEGTPVPLGYTLDPGGETYSVQMPPGWRAPGTMSRREFAARLTLPEWAGIHQSTDPMIRHWLYLLQLADEVRLDDPDVSAAVEYAEQIGLIAEGRAAEILEP